MSRWFKPASPHSGDHLVNRAYVSIALPMPSTKVWAKISDFADYRWGEGVGDATLDGPPEQIGTIRSFRYYDTESHQRLTQRTDRNRTIAWESTEAFDPTLSHYVATMQVHRITVGDQSFVEWSSDFEATADRAESWRAMQEREFRKSLDRLALCLRWDARAAG